MTVLKQNPSRMRTESGHWWERAGVYYMWGIPSSWLGFSSIFLGVLGGGPPWARGFKTREISIVTAPIILLFFKVVLRKANFWTVNFFWGSRCYRSSKNTLKVEGMACFPIPQVPNFGSTYLRRQCTDFKTPKTVNISWNRTFSKSQLLGVHDAIASR